MRKSDKKLNIKRVNILQEQKYLEAKGVLVERLSGELKRRAFDSGLDKYNNTPDDAKLHKDKLKSQTDTFYQHINPEIKSLVDSIGEKYGFTTYIDKEVRGSEHVPYVIVCFSNVDTGSISSCDFKIVILKDSYEFSRFDNSVEKPKDFDRILLRLISKIQQAEF